MRVTFNTFETGFLHRLQKLNQQQDQANNEIATGQRVTVPSDDPAAMRRAMDYRAEKKQVQQFAYNSNRALDVSQVTFSSLDGLRKLNTRAGELAIMANGTAAPEQFIAYGSEMGQLIEEGVNNANAKLGGDFVLGGVKTDTPPFAVARDAAGQITGVTYQGAAAGAEFRISESGTIAPFTNGTENQQVADFLNQLVSLRDAFKAKDPAAVAAVRPQLSTSEDHLLSSIARTGGVQYRLEVASKQASDRYLSLEGLISREVDVDYAEAAVRLNRAQSAYEAALQSGARIESKNLLDYLH